MINSNLNLSKGHRKGATEYGSPPNHLFTSVFEHAQYSSSVSRYFNTQIRLNHILKYECEA